MFKKGFTVIELVVVIAIMGVLTVVASQFLIAVIQGNNRATIENEVRQNAEAIRNDLVAEIRKSLCVRYDPASGSNLSKLSLSDTPDPSPIVTCTSGKRTVTYVVDATAATKGQVTKTIVDSVNGTSTLIMTSPSTALLYCSGSCSTQNCSTGLVANPSGGSWVINIYAMQSSTNGTRSDFCANVNLNDAATQRQY